MSRIVLRRIALLGLALFWPGLFGGLLIPGAARAAELPEKVVLANFPFYGQQHNLSCEYSSTRMITAFWDREIGESDFIAGIPFDANPHKGFRGNIDSWFGGIDQYGIYPEPIVRFLGTRGFQTRLLANGAEGLKAELAAGHPVQIWVIAEMGWSNPFQTEVDGQEFWLAPAEHSMVAYGYDANGIYVADPAFGGADYYGWATFLRSWSYLGFMGMAVWPADKPVTSTLSPGVDAAFYRYWLNNGRVELLGLPVGPAWQKGNKTRQYFERARLEATGDYIQGGLLGRELTASRQQELPFRPLAASPNPNALFFGQTGHSLGGEFRNFWEQQGGLAQFGYPLSEEFSEGGRIVQYFERARFEFYPTNPDPYKVLLGRVGAERLAER